MNKALSTVTKFEFVRQIKKPAFWASVLIMPIILVGSIVVMMLIPGGETIVATELDENTTIAITDEAGILSSNSPFVVKSDEKQGIEMVKNGDVALYFHIPADFKETKHIELYHISEGLDLFNSDSQVIKVILSQSVASKFDDIDVIALTGNFEVVDNKLTITGENENALGKMIIPIAFLALFFLFIVLFGSRLLMTVVEEKENRISEMILTSVSAKHLIIGKVIAMMLLGGIQILTFILPLIVILLVYQDNVVVSSILSMIEFTPAGILSNLVLFILSTALVIGICTYIGAITPTAKDASSFIGPIIVTLVVPLYFMQFFMAAEPNALVYFFTYFPTSAPIALMLRSAFGTLTTPELIVGCIEIAIFACFINWLTIRTFQKNAINFSIVKPELPKLLSSRKKH